jgi:hypothetical protein
MKQAQVVLDEVVTLARQLEPLDKVRLAERLMADLEACVQGGDRTPLHSAYGACADLGRAPSPEEIRQTREEVFGDFPGNDRQ